MAGTRLFMRRTEGDWMDLAAGIAAGSSFTPKNS